MKKLITVAVVSMIFMIAGFVSAITTFAPITINTTANDGFLYLYPAGLGTPGTPATQTVTFFYSQTANLPPDSIQLTLEQATPPSPVLVPDTINGLDLFSGTLTLPVGAGFTATAPGNAMTFSISAICVGYGEYTFKGTNAGVLVSGTIYARGKQYDRTETTVTKQYTFEINGEVTGNTGNFNGAFHGKLYE